MVIIKLRTKRVPDGIQVRVFSGKKNQTLACNGTLLFYEHEWEIFQQLFVHYPFNRVREGKTVFLMKDHGGEILIEEEG